MIYLNKRQGKQGFSLIELMLTFAILIVLMIGAFFIYKKVKVGNEVNSVISDLNIIYSNYKSISGQKNDMIVNGSDSKVYDFLTNGIYEKKGLTLGSGSIMIYTNKNSLVQFGYSPLSDNRSVLSMAFFVDQAACPSIVEKLLASGNYMVRANASDYSSATYASKNNPYVGIPESGVNLSTNYNSTDIIQSCNAKISQQMAASLGNAANYSTLLIYI